MCTHLLVTSPRLVLVAATLVLGPHEPTVARAAWVTALAALLGAVVALALDVQARRAFLLARVAQPPGSPAHNAAAGLPGGSCGGGGRGEAVVDAQQRVGGGVDGLGSGPRARRPNAGVPGT
jgi:hypothetical protein